MRMNAKDPKRVELLPETEDERRALQLLVEAGKPWNREAAPDEPLAYWGDSDVFNVALILNMYRVDPNNPPVVEADASPVAAV